MRMGISLKFKTSSGTEYILKNVEIKIEATEEPCPSVGPQGIPVNVTYTGELARIGSPLRDVSTGGSFDTTGAFYFVEFTRRPAVGNSFSYYHEQWAGCYSTPITELSPDEYGDIVEI